jgi:hypothetical protein
VRALLVLAIHLPVTYAKPRRPGDLRMVMQTKTGERSFFVCAA